MTFLNWNYVERKKEKKYWKDGLVLLLLLLLPQLDYIINKHSSRRLCYDMIIYRKKERKKERLKRI